MDASTQHNHGDSQQVRDGGTELLTANAFDRLVEAVSPASLLVVIESRLGTALKSRLTPEDILQESLLHAWRDRANAPIAASPKPFRAWLLTIIQNRICDAADREFAQKRGGDITITGFQPNTPCECFGSAAAEWQPPVSTTPSRVAMFREQANVMRCVLESLPEDVREVVRLRLFEQRTIEEIATVLEIGSSAVRHRFRRGAEAYQTRLFTHLGTQCSSTA